MGRVVAECGGWPGSDFGQGFVKISWTVFFSVLYWASITLGWFVGIHLYNWHIAGLVLYCGFGTLNGLVRYGVRTRYMILHGDMITDLVCGFCAPMFTISQCEVQMLEPAPK